MLFCLIEYETIFAGGLGNPVLDLVRSGDFLVPEHSA
jgi:hypothetical protein